VVRHVLIVWELGGNLGHLGRLDVLATSMARQNAKVTFAVRNYAAAKPWLAARGWACVRAPQPRANSWGIRAPVGHADWYLCDGFDRPDNVMTLVEDWSALMVKLKPDAVLLDFAPSATYAVHCLKLPYLVSSIGFCVPPSFDQSICFRPWDAQAKVFADQTHMQLTGVFEIARKTLGTNAALGFSDLFAAEHVSLCTFAEMDHFPQRIEAPTYFGAIWGDLPESPSIQWNQTSHKKIFCYLNGAPEHITLFLKLLKSCGHDVIAVVPRLSKEEVVEFSTPLFRVFLEPLNISTLLEECDLIACHGGAGLVGRALCAGVPLFLMPHFVEQALLARRLSQQKLAVATSETSVPETLERKFNIALTDPSVRLAVEAFAEKYKGFAASDAAQRSVSQWF
jgi:UDP:flavonoid glycosyltransferase YjiC (YdhE family)